MTCCQLCWYINWTSTPITLHDLSEQCFARALSSQPCKHGCYEDRRDNSCCIIIQVMFSLGSQTIAIDTHMLCCFLQCSWHPLGLQKRTNRSNIRKQICNQSNLWRTMKNSKPQTAATLHHTCHADNTAPSTSELTSQKGYVRVRTPCHTPKDGHGQELYAHRGTG